MNTDQIHGHLREMKGWALESWGRVTHDPWLKIAGRRERLLGREEIWLAKVVKDAIPAARRTN